jgi:hypothetical protein
VIHSLPEPHTHQLERSPTSPGLAPYPTRLVTTPDHRGARRQPRGRQPVASPRPRGRPGGSPPPTATRGPTSPDHRTAGPAAPLLAPRRRSVWLSRAGLHLWPDCRGDSPGVWHHLPPAPCQPPPPSHPLEPAKARPACAPARRNGHHARAGGNLACAQKGAQAQGQTILIRDPLACIPLFTFWAAPKGERV